MTVVGREDLSKLLIVLPHWVGDVVLATPVLRSIRKQLPGSQITYLMRAYVQDVLHGCPWPDRTEIWPPSQEKSFRGLIQMARHLRVERYDCVLLLPNSFRTGLLARLTRARRRIGYARDGRSWLLTDRLSPPRERGHYKIESMLTYYGRLSEYIGCPPDRGALQLYTDEASDREVARWWREWGIDGRPTIVLNPGGAFGSSKLYPPQRFAEVGAALARHSGARILITAGPTDLEAAKAVQHHLKGEALLITPPQLNLRLLKSLIARSDLLVTNDTGPRHFAIALGVPVVTIFGPTHPGWTESHYAFEKKVFVPVDCGPCQKPVCPLDHRCMTGIGPEMVVSEALAVLDAKKEARNLKPEPNPDGRSSSRVGTAHQDREGLCSA